MPVTLPILSSDEADLYKEIYRCERCSHLTDPTGVFSFASRSAPDGQTVPVSHFGRIRTAVVWLFLTNPRGTDRSDSNVGLGVRDFATNRNAIPTSEVPRIFQQFSDYNFDTSSPDFWKPWKALLDAIRVGGKTVTFDSGGICAVDLIKCPTKRNWMGYVMSKENNEGKEVWGNCHELKKRIGNRFLARQIKLHSPRVIICPGTNLNGRGNGTAFLGTKTGLISRALNRLLPNTPNGYVKSVSCLSSPKRLTIKLGRASDVTQVTQDPEGSTECKNTIQRIIDTWLALTEKHEQPLPV